MKNCSLILNLIKRRDFQRREAEQKPFESASIGDLAFLLLIFFIITSSFLLRQGIFFFLPSREAGAIKIEEKQIIDVYPKNTGFQYNGKILDRFALKKLLIARGKEVPGSVLIIHMDPEIKYESLVDTLSLAKESGLTKVSLKDAEGGS